MVEGSRVDFTLLGLDVNGDFCAGTGRDVAHFEAAARRLCMR